MADEITIKLGLAAAILVAAWIGGAIPLLRHAAGGAFPGLGNAFAAGIFLGSGLIHMLGEAHDTWMELGWDYPIAFVLAGVGFIAILLFEHVLLPEPAHEMVHAHTGESATQREMHAVSDSVYPYMLVVALSVHSVVAGVALGSQNTFADLLIIFLAIIAHKSTEGFALGVSLRRHHVPRLRSYGLIMLLAVMTPLGVIGGMTVSGLLESGPERLFDAVFLALAAGTFIYIAALDILQDEFLRPGSRLLKWIFASLGFAVTAMLAVWV